MIKSVDNTHSPWRSRALISANTHGCHYVYSVYGHMQAKSLSATLKFNGEHIQLETYYLLGNGYRVYSPTLMRFFSSDNFSPFSSAGINSYVYCKNDPTNFIDPSGHMRRYPSPGTPPPSYSKANPPPSPPPGYRTAVSRPKGPKAFVRERKMPPLNSLFAEADLALADPSINDTRSPSSTYNTPAEPVLFSQQTARNPRIQSTSTLLSDYEKQLSQTMQQSSHSPYNEKLKDEVKFLSKRIMELRQQQSELNSKGSALLF